MSSEKSTGLLNFPSDSFLGTLVSSFPSEWQGCFGVLNAAGPSPVQNASIWLQQKQIPSQNSQIPPSFSILFDHLTQDFPVVLENDLYFKPKILLFPLHLRRNILSFVLSQSSLIPLELFRKLVTKLDEFKDILEEWSSTLRNLLKVKIKELEKEEESSCQEEKTTFCVNVITDQSKERFLSLCEKINNIDNPCSAKEYLSETKWIFLEDEKEEKMDENLDMSPDTSRLLAEICDDDLELELIENWDENENIENEKMDIDVAENFETGISDQKAAENEKTVASSPSKKGKMKEHIEEMTPVIPPAPEAFEVAHEESAVTNKLKAKITPLQDLLQALESPEVVKPENCLEALKIFCELSSCEFENISNIIKVEKLTDQSLATFCQNFAALELEPSYMHACAFATHFILPRLLKLEQTASRLLTSAVISFGKRYPKAICEGLFIKLLTDVSFCLPQADIISRTLKDMSNKDTSKYLLEILLKALNSSEKDGWNEDKVTVIQTIIDGKPILDDSLFKNYISLLQESSVAMTSKSLKFAKLLLATINNYGTQIVDHKDTMEGILQRNETFLKKAGLAALKKALAKVQI